MPIRLPGGRPNKTTEAAAQSESVTPAETAADDSTPCDGTVPPSVPEALQVATLMVDGFEIPEGATISVQVNIQETPTGPFHALELR